MADRETFILILQERGGRENSIGNEGRPRDGREEAWAGHRHTIFLVAHVNDSFQMIAGRKYKMTFVMEIH